MQNSSMSSYTYLEIDLAAIKHNVQEIKKRIHPRVLAVVKSNAYGHGAIAVVKILNNLADGFMVDNVNEAIEIKKVAKKPILVMLAATKNDIEILAKNKISFALFDFYQLAIIKKISQKLNRKILVHLKIDTGMNRLGFKKYDWQNLKNKLKNYNKYLKVIGIFSHYAKADDQKFSKSQQKIMGEAIKFFKISNCLSHFSASLAALNYRNSDCGAIRIGASLYGYSSENNVSWLKQALSLKTRIVQLKWVEPNEAVGYELFFKPKRKTLIGIIPIGYKDNFSRKFSFTKTKVIIKGKKFNIVGRICMRFAYVDVTNLASKIKIGDEVILLGKEKSVKIDASDWAQKLDTSFYEILATFPRDLPRIYK